MRATQSLLVVSLLIWGILVLSSATEELECKNQCKHDLHNKKECDEKMMMMMMKMKQEEQDPFCEEMMAIEQQQVEGGHDGAANGDLQAKHNIKCASYTSHNRCIGKKMDNEAVCESSCSILQEKPLIVRCIRVCHERIPGTVDLLLLKK